MQPMKPSAKMMATEKNAARKREAAEHLLPSLAEAAELHAPRADGEEQPRAQGCCAHGISRLSRGLQMSLRFYSFSKNAHALTPKKPCAMRQPSPLELHCVPSGGAIHTLQRACYVLNHSLIANDFTGWMGEYEYASSI